MSNGAADKSMGVSKQYARSPNILIVDSSLPLRLAISSYLQNYDLNPIEANDASEAIQKLNNPLMKIDLVFTAVELNGEMNGFEFANWVQRNRPGTPIILAGEGSAQTLALAKAVSMREPFFMKPYKFDEIAIRIKHILMSQMGIWFS